GLLLLELRRRLDALRARATTLRGALDEDRDRRGRRERVLDRRALGRLLDLLLLLGGGGRRGECRRLGCAGEGLAGQGKGVEPDALDRRAGHGAPGLGAAARVRATAGGRPTAGGGRLRAPR